MIKVGWTKKFVHPTNENDKAKWRFRYETDGNNYLGCDRNSGRLVCLCRMGNIPKQSGQPADDSNTDLNQ